MSRPMSAALDDLTASAETLMRTIADLSDDQVREPSLLPGWTRGHVLTHVARNGDGIRNLLTWAQTGVETPMYPSPEARSADIEAGSTRSASDLVADVAASHERLMSAFRGVDPPDWDNTIVWGRHQRRIAAGLLPPVRRVEVEIHHVDLDLDYTLAHLPPALTLELLADSARDLSAADRADGFVLVANDDEGCWTVGGGGQEITGTPTSLLGWVLGRTDGIGLHSDEPLPSLGPWR